MEDRQRYQQEYPQVLDAAQVAELLQLNIDYVRKLSRQGVLPAHKLPGGRTFRYFKDEVFAWLRSQPVGDERSVPDAGAGQPDASPRR